jgi:hypothetical protein
MLAFRNAREEDVRWLAAMNYELIRDERHRNPMNEAQLADRMALWLKGEYQQLVIHFASYAAQPRRERREGGRTRPR